MSDTFAEGVERLRETAADLPRLLDDATHGVATYAAALSELVQGLDIRRTALNEHARRIGAPVVPDVVTGSVPSEDAVRARLIAAARRGPGELAVGLGKAARRPACQPGAAAPSEAGSGMGDAARAATALLTLMPLRDQARADGYEPDEVVEAFAADEVDHELWEHFARKQLEGGTLPVDREKWGIKVNPDFVAPDVILVRLLPVPPGGVVQPGEMYASVPLLMQYDDGPGWRLLNFLSERIPVPGWPPQLGA